MEVIFICGKWLAQNCSQLFSWLVHIQKFYIVMGRDFSFCFLFDLFFIEREVLSIGELLFILFFFCMEGILVSGK